MALPVMNVIRHSLPALKGRATESFLALQVKTKQLEDLLRMQAAVLKALEQILPGQFLLVLAADEADS